MYSTTRAPSKLTLLARGAWPIAGLTNHDRNVLCIPVYTPKWKGSHVDNLSWSAHDVVAIEVTVISPVTDYNAVTATILQVSKTFVHKHTGSPRHNVMAVLLCRNPSYKSFLSSQSQSCKKSLWVMHKKMIINSGRYFHVPEHVSCREMCKIVTGIIRINTILFSNKNKTQKFHLWAYKTCARGVPGLVIWWLQMSWCQMGQ